ncbi:MAG TPA: response regulator [Aggregatilineales bacterium]|nr:response regulator [Aggregatilineales bacterium]
MSLKGKRIFYIEDNVGNRSLVEVLMEQRGAQCAFERWGDKDVVRRLMGFMPVDLILLDLMLPNNVSGYDVFDMLRTIPALNAIPIAVTSAADPSIEMPRSRAKGLAGYIAKPISVLFFPSQIADLIAGKHVWYGG